MPIAARCGWQLLDRSHLHQQSGAQIHLQFFRQSMHVAQFKFVWWARSGSQLQKLRTAWLQILGATVKTLDHDVRLMRAMRAPKVFLKSKTCCQQRSINWCAPDYRLFLWYSRVPSPARWTEKRLWVGGGTHWLCETAVRACCCCNRGRTFYSRSAMLPQPPATRQLAAISSNRGVPPSGLSNLNDPRGEPLRPCTC